MNLTIYTDAGLSPHGQAYAFQCISDKGKIKKAVYIHHHFDDILQVEAYAVYSAIKESLDLWQGVSIIFVRCDNLLVVNALNNKKFNGSNKRFNKIIKATVGFGIKISAKHVRGHQRGRHVEAFLNNWCDDQLKRVRTKYSTKLKRGSA